MDCSFFVYRLGNAGHFDKLSDRIAHGSLLFALRFAPCSNVLASAMLKQVWHCARLVVTSLLQSRRLVRCRQRFEHHLELRNRLHRS